jgi:hypothetical protein
LTQRNRADDFTTVSTVVTISGLSMAVVGLAIWLLAPPAKRQSALGTMLQAHCF